MPERDEPIPSSDLDEEGIPDHVGPLPAQDLTGDPQEGVWPPGDRPVAAEDFGTTRQEEREGDSLGERIAREAPDAGADVEDRDEARGAGHRTGRVVEPSQGAGPDREKDEVGEERRRDPGAYSDEERAVRARGEPR